MQVLDTCCLRQSSGLRNELNPQPKPDPAAPDAEGGKDDVKDNAKDDETKLVQDALLDQD